MELWQKGSTFILLGTRVRLHLSSDNEYMWYERENSLANMKEGEKERGGIVQELLGKGTIGPKQPGPRDSRTVPKFDRWGVFIFRNGKGGRTETPLKRFVQLLI